MTVHVTGGRADAGVQAPREFCAVSAYKLHRRRRRRSRKRVHASQRRCAATVGEKGCMYDAGYQKLRRKVPPPEEQGARAKRCERRDLRQRKRKPVRRRRLRALQRVGQANQRREQRAGLHPARGEQRALEKEAKDGDEHEGRCAGTFTRSSTAGPRHASGEQMNSLRCCNTDEETSLFTAARP